MHCPDLGRSSLRCSRSYGRFRRHRTWSKYKNTCWETLLSHRNNLDLSLSFFKSWSCIESNETVHLKSCDNLQFCQQSSTSCEISTPSNSARSHNRVQTCSPTLFETLGSFEISIPIKIFGRADCPQPELNSDEQRRNRITQEHELHCRIELVTGFSNSVHSLTLTSASPSARRGVCFQFHGNNHQSSHSQNHR